MARRVNINLKGLKAEIERKGFPQLKAKTEPLIRKSLAQETQKMLAAFDQHPVTEEIEGGESAQTTRTGTLSAADSALSSEIRRKLGEYEGLSQHAFGIRTRAGRVTLTGTVGSYQLRDQAISIVRDTDGVRAVDSRIIVNTNQ